jgi:hypothetical protein
MKPLKYKTLLKQGYYTVWSPTLLLYGNGKTKESCIKDFICYCNEQYNDLRKSVKAGWGLSPWLQKSLDNLMLIREGKRKLFINGKRVYLIKK